MIAHWQKNLYTIGFILAITLSMFALSRFITPLHPQFAISLIAGMVIVVLSFIRQDLAAIILIFSMLLSPELEVASLPRREVVIRFDDIILITFFFSWLFKMAYLKNMSMLKITSLNLPIWSYILAALLSTWRGITVGDIQIVSSLFYFLKYVEYFIVFFMFSNIIHSEEQLRKFLAAFFITAAFVSVYGLIQILIGVPRITAPFEGESGEPNTLGGYLLLVIGIAGLGCLKAPDLRKKIAYGAGALFLAGLLAATYSRASYLGFIALLLGMLCFAKPAQRTYLIVILLVALLMSPLLMTSKMKERISGPFQGETEEVAPFLRLNPEDSIYLKVKSAAYVIREWTENPILGKGVTGVGLVDTQYPRILGETGLLGAFSFLWILLAIYRAYQTARKALDRYQEEEAWQWRALVAGYFCSLLGILVHGLGANTFVIVRIMEPFWFLTAVMVALPSVLAAKDTEKSLARERQPRSPTPQLPPRFAGY